MKQGDQPELTGGIGHGLDSIMAGHEETDQTVDDKGFILRGENKSGDELVGREDLKIGD